MNKLAIPLALGAVALVAACAHRAAPAPAPVVVVPQQAPAVVVAQPVALRAGFGRVESVSAAPASSGAGSTAPGALRRLGIRMEDGTVQYVDSDAPNVSVGDRVQLTADGYIRPA